MKKYLHDKNVLNWPWVESPFFWELIKKDHSPLRSKAIDFHISGYLVIDLELSPETLSYLRWEVDRVSRSGAKTQETGYHYTNHKRIFEAWKSSKALRKLSMHPKILQLLRYLYIREPIPFQTITFDYGSNQPLHSDTIHFDSMPHRWMAAAWVALEDMTTDNGTLQYVPGSHKLPLFDFYDLNIKTPQYGEQFEAYAEYENFIASLVEANQLERRELICPAGHALVWASNLLHGGTPIKDPTSTRYSHVTHYYFEGCDKYYSPMFSDAWCGKFSEKDLSNKNIRKY